MHIANVKNRGYYKIKGACDAFDFDFRNKIVLDIGSSTGGFTWFALDRGARRVVAIEKGTKQMLPILRGDSRIELYEKTDIFDVRVAKELAKKIMMEEGRLSVRKTVKETTRNETVLLGVVPDVIMADVSFISLVRVLEHVRLYIANSHTDLLVMLKPQFEARPYQLHDGIVKNEKIRREIIKNFEQWLKRTGFVIIHKHDNNLHGKNGNRERFYWLKISK